jgi:hypothetical protein
MKYRYTGIVCALVIAACSSAPHARDEAAQAQYLAYAGEPIDQFTYLGRFDSWRALSRTQLIVWTTVVDAYLLTVQEPCNNLLFANRIGVSATFGTVHRGLDSVLIRDDRCPISEIRPVDYRRMRADRRNAAHAAKPAQN